MVNTGTTLTVANGADLIDMMVNGILENRGVITPTGRLDFGATGIYQHNRNGGTIPASTWNNYSTCEIIGLTSTAAGGGAQSFYNLTWNCPLQTGNFTTAATFFKNIRGLLKVVSTGTGRWIWNGTALTSKTIGTYEQSGGYIDLSAGTFNTVVELTGSFTMTGGTFTGDKYVTFYWNDADDNSYDWSMDQPAVYQGNVKLSAELYDTDADPSWITVIMTNTFTKAVYRVGTDSGQTLPIELSSFTAVQTNTGKVRLQWITQSETGGLGYQVLRNQNPDLNSALQISSMIPATNSSYSHTYIFEDSELDGPGIYYYWLRTQFLDGTSTFFGPLLVEVTENGGTELPEIPVVTAVKGIYPNPFNPSTTLSYELAENELVSLSIFNPKGQLIRKFAPVSTPPGSYRITWDGTDSNGRTVSSGVYIFRFTAGRYNDLRRAVLVK